MNGFTAVSISDQVQEDYLAYSMAVLLGRAIPSLYDGMKPVQRRILAAMKGLNLKPDGRFIKSARVEGEVMGKLHPHGSAYGAMVTLAAPHTNNHPPINGHGNWGSSTDPAASSRYTECKISEFAWDCLLQNSDTWETRDNYDGSMQEPVNLDTAIPYVLLNGQEGIGVGLATRVLPHNLRGIVRAIAKVPLLSGEDGLEAAAAMREELIPDFPTGCEIVRDENLEKYQRTGSGSIRLRAYSEIGTLEKAGRAKDRATVTFTHLPPNLNPEKLGEQIKNALEKGSLDGVAEIIDESDLSGDRVVVVGKPNVSGEELVVGLSQCTDVDTKISAKTLVIEGTKPVEMSPSQIVEKWVDWRMGRLSYQFEFKREKQKSRLHIVEGLLRAIDELDAVIATIRASKNRDEALNSLTEEPFVFSSEQAVAILEMRLRQLTNLDKKDLLGEKKDLSLSIKELSVLIENDTERLDYLVKETETLAERHGNARRSCVVGGVAQLNSGVAVKAAPAPKVAKPRFIKVDEKKGIVSVAKGPRGAIILEPKEKLVVVSSDQMVRKLPHAFKGAIGLEAMEILFVAREVVAQAKNYLVVFRNETELRAMTIDGAKLCSTTAKGKRLIPEGFELVGFGGTYEVPWNNPRKKKVVLAAEEKGSAPGGRGRKVAALTELAL